MKGRTQIEGYLKEEEQRSRTFEKSVVTKVMES